MTGIDPPHVSSVSFEPVIRSFLVLLNINLHAGIMHTCPTRNIRIHEHFKTFPEESLLPDTLPPLNGTNPWLDYKAHHTEACMGLQLSTLFLLQSTCLWPKWVSPHTFSAKYSGDSLPPTLVSQRARSIAVSTNSCVIGGDLPKLTT